MTENDIIWSGKWCLLMTSIDIYFLLFNNYSLFLRNSYINTVKYDQIISFPFSSSFYTLSIWSLSNFMLPYIGLLLQ